MKSAFPSRKAASPSGKSIQLAAITGTDTTFITPKDEMDSGTTYYLPRMVGTSKALELMLTGELFDAAEALRLGIVSRVVAPDELLKTAQELAARIARQAPIAVELTKRVVYRGMIDDIRRQIDWESGAQQTCMQTEDHKESVRAFLEKREPPKWKGK